MSEEFICNLCNYIFKTKYSLKRHVDHYCKNIITPEIKSITTNSKYNIFCEYCKKNFQRKIN